MLNRIGTSVRYSRCDMWIEPFLFGRGALGGAAIEGSIEKGFARGAEG